jgi:hypothetical protein
LAPVPVPPDGVILIAWLYGDVLLEMFIVKERVAWAIWFTVIVVAEEEIDSYPVVAAFVAVTEHDPAEVLERTPLLIEQFPLLTT